MKVLHNCLKTLHTNITLTHFTFCETHQSLARNQKLFPESRSERVNTEISLRNIFSNLQQISTLNQNMFNCDSNESRKQTNKQTKNSSSQ